MCEFTLFLYTQLGTSLTYIHHTLSICVWSWSDEVGLIQEDVWNVWEEKIMTSLVSPEPHAQTAIWWLEGGMGVVYVVHSSEGRAEIIQ